MGSIHTFSQKRTGKRIIGVSSFVIVLFFTLISTNFNSTTSFTKINKLGSNDSPQNSALIWSSLDISNINTWENYPQLANGTGTIENPYIIENVTFDAQLISHALKISNSQAYTKIRNCTFINSKNSVLGSISLINSSNIQISNCSIVNNDQDGIYFRNSWNNSIENNTIEDNSGSGINFYSSQSNNISNNNILSNTGVGILITFSSHNLIFNNTISYCGVGINIIYYSNYNTASYNTLTYNNYDAFQLRDSSYNTITENYLSNNVRNTIKDHDDDSTNLIYNNYGLDSVYTNSNTEYDYFDFPENSHDSNFINPIIIIIIVIFLLLFIGGIILNNSSRPYTSSTSRYRLIHSEEPDNTQKTFNINPSNPTTSLREIERPKRTKILNPILYCPNCGSKVSSKYFKIDQPSPQSLFCVYCGANLHN